MKVLKLSLANYRGFEQIDITFESDVTVIAGVNGVGKSSILKALAMAHSHLLNDAVPEFKPAIAPTKRDVRAGSTMTNVVLTEAVATKAVRATILHELPDKAVAEKVKRRIERLRKGQPAAPTNPQIAQKLKEEEQFLKNLIDEEETTTVFEYFESISTGTSQVLAGSTKAKQELKALLQGGGENLPLMIYYSALRTPDKPARIARQARPPTARVVANQMQLTSRLPAMAGALDGQVTSLAHALQWMQVQSHLTTDDNTRLKIVAQMQHALVTLLPGFVKFDFSDGAQTEFLLTKGELEFAIDQLSDGERTLMAIALDLAYRINVTSPQNNNPVAEVEACVLIDELELHLHPAWQRTLLLNLREVFKSTQFIVTSHSPQVLGEVESRCLRCLTKGADGKLFAWKPDHSLGLDSSRVLEELMGVPPRNKVIGDRLKELFEAIDKEEFPLAKENLQALTNTLGEQDAEITRATALLKFLEDVG